MNNTSADFRYENPSTDIEYGLKKTELKIRKKVKRTTYLKFWIPKSILFSALFTVSKVSATKTRFFSKIYPPKDQIASVPSPKSLRGKFQRAEFIDSGWIKNWSSSES